ncbi:TMEM175 family protein [Pediococcus argentinicus]|uniref:TMEM175 family protein n=1 Tax=Pediococcus argentinicus TaxID=480391 RepID=UPI00338FC704
MNIRDRLANLVDGVVAIIATISILSLPVPHGNDYQSLFEFGVNFWLFIVNFLIILSFWNNQRFLLDHMKTVHTRFVWINIYWLMFLSGLPIITKWMMTVSHSLIAILAFGLDNIFTKLVFTFAVVEGIRANYQGDSTEHLLLRRYFYSVLIDVLYSVVTVLVAFVNPTIAISMFILLPLFGSVRGLWRTPGKRMRQTTHSEHRKSI